VKQNIESPAALGFAHAAEWQPHEATWLGWPHNYMDWPGKFAAIPWAYAEIVRKLTPGEIVRIVVESAAHEARARRVLKRAGADLSRVEFFRFPTDRGWMRDSGPMFVRRGGPDPEVAVMRFKFNAWAKYPNWKKDVHTHERAAKTLGLKMFCAMWEGKEVVLEGGAIDTNGTGSMLTTEECLLDQETQVRNPELGKKEMAEIFRTYLGISNVIWLGNGLAGDDTHGHVDDLCRFVTRNTVVLCSEKNPADANYKALHENHERMQDVRLEDGSRINVVSLPMPAPLTFDGRRLPASYANFLFGNAAVIVPTFNDSNDRVALGILSELITDRPVVGIHAVDLVWGFGTLHCLSHEQPAREQ
jgi:agmatine deiminase